MRLKENVASRAPTDDRRQTEMMWKAIIRLPMEPTRCLLPSPHLCLQGRDVTTEIQLARCRAQKSAACTRVILLRCVFSSDDDHLQAPGPHIDMLADDPVSDMEMAHALPKDADSKLKSIPIQIDRARQGKTFERSVEEPPNKKISLKDPGCW